jgi:hypothetical protein
MIPAGTLHIAMPEAWSGFIPMEIKRLPINQTPAITPKAIINPYIRNVIGPRSKDPELGLGIDINIYCYPHSLSSLSVAT